MPCPMDVMEYDKIHNANFVRSWTIINMSINRTLKACLKWTESHSVVSYSLWPHELHSPWNRPGQNTGVGSLSLLQGIFPAQGSNPGLLHCRWILYQLSHQGSLPKTTQRRELVFGQAASLGFKILWSKSFGFVFMKQKYVSSQLSS